MFRSYRPPTRYSMNQQYLSNTGALCFLEATQNLLYFEQVQVYNQADTLQLA